MPEKPIPLLKKLRSHAAKQPGYISSKTLKSEEMGTKQKKEENG